jgi:hypothetical protein
MRALVAAAVILAGAALPARAAEPIVSLWYRGSVAGMPRLEDLEAIRAAGFHAVTWPAGRADRLQELGLLARRAGLAVVLEPDIPPFDIANRLTVQVSRTDVRQIPAIVWRAVGRGARVISFDPGRASVTALLSGAPPGWVETARRLARQLSANAVLFDALAPADRPSLLPPHDPGLDVGLAASPRAWVVIATNTGSTSARAEVRLPSGVPYAIWVSLIDGTSVAMSDRPDGARWTVMLAPGEAKVYVIDKTLK